jgi:hypothetical protein
VEFGEKLGTKQGPGNNAVRFEFNQSINHIDEMSAEHVFKQTINQVLWRLER